MRWIKKSIGKNSFHALNLDHPDIEDQVMDEMSQGVSVYYDTRWKVTGAFCHWLVDHPTLVKDKAVLVIGAGVGLENLVVAQQAATIGINDWAPVSLKLCAEQLKKNGFENFELIEGDYTKIHRGNSWDIALGCYVVYDRETARNAEIFFDRFAGDIILVNPPLIPFTRLIKRSRRSNEVLMDSEEGLAVLFRLS